MGAELTFLSFLLCCVLLCFVVLCAVTVPCCVVDVV